MKLWAAASFVVLISCAGNREPAKILIGSNDTVIVNNVRAVRLASRILSKDGHSLPDSLARYQWISGDTIPVGADGIVTCGRPADATIRVSAGNVATQAILHCRPVEKVRVEAPMQFILPGDSAHTVRVQATDAQGSPVTLLAGSLMIRDSSVATWDGMKLRPRIPGTTVAGIRIGNRDAGMGVHVYERVSTLDDLRPDQRLVAVELKMTPGESKSWRLRPGGWMLTMLPEEDSQGIRLRVEGATCSPGFTKRRLVCATKDGATVMVYHPSAAGSGSIKTGYLLVRNLGDL